MTFFLRRSLLVASMALSSTATACAATLDEPGTVNGQVFSYISLPENRAVSESRDIDVAYLRMEGTSGGVPTFVFFGGPGESATDYDTLDDLREAYGHLLAQGDVIFVEQRGVGASRPSLDCEAIRFPMDRPVTAQSMREAHARVLPACVEAAGADMRGYTTEAIADDADAIRKELGYTRINLSGGSYGAQQAYFYIRRYGEHVNRAVLTQFLVPGTSLAMPSTIDDYIAQIGDRVGPAYGQSEGGGDALTNLIRTAFDAVEAEPVEIQVGEVSVTAGREDLQVITSLGLRRTRETWLLPMLFTQMNNGEFGFVGQIMLQFYRQGLPVNAAVIAFDCADQVDPARRARFEDEAASALTGPGAHLPFPAACDTFDHGILADAYRRPGDLHSVPTLFIQGELDARARDENLGPVLAGQDNARLLVIGNATHDLGRSVSDTINAELNEIEASFLFDGQWPEHDRIDVPLSLD